MSSRADQPAPTSTARRRARILLGVAAVVAIGGATVAALEQSPDPAAEEARPPSDVSPDPHLRTSEGLTREGDGGPATEAGPDETSTAPAPVEWPLGDDSGGGGSQTPVERAPGATAPTRAGVESRPGTGSTAVAPPARPAPPSAPDLPDPLYLPGAGQAPILGPIGGDDAEDDDVDDPIVTDPSEETEEPVQHREEPPDPDEAGCPVLNLYPIGGYAEGAPANFAVLSPKFRALAPAEWARPSLVCGHALEPWRDLVIQRLVTQSRADGVLITAADGSSMVMRLSETEWATYRFRYGEGPIGVNLIGFPTGRTTWDGVWIIQTTAGGLVFGHPEAMGVPLIGGAWDLWVASGGPSGPMGIPTGRPESAVGPIGADTWVAGLPSTGARQEFTNGWLFLPGVLTDVEAAAQPADRYEWHDVSELGPLPNQDFDYRGHVMQISGISFYVDMDGTRHWIRSTSDWSCATGDLRAVEYAVRGAELARYPLGVEFNCDDYRSNHR